MNPTRSVLCASVLAAASLSANATDYRFDTVHTQIFFSASHLGLSNPLGRLHVKSGSIHFDTGDWANAKVDATIDTTSLDMGDEAWNHRLRSNEFLDSGKFPTAHFVSDKIEKSDDKNAVVHGKLTLLGVTRPVDLKVTFNRAAVDPYSLLYTAGFSASATFKRSDFGMKKYAEVIGDEVAIRIEVEGLRGADTKGQAAPEEKTEP
jgi:polyisoprenoid-binding protein YceI